MLVLIWVTITSLIMVLHWRLFKRGVWFNHMQGQDEAKRRFACFEFCRGPAANPASKVLTAIGMMMFDPDGEGRPHLKLLHSKYGNTTAELPLALLEELHGTLVLSFARLWRLLFYYFLFYPWLLAPALDPTMPEEERWDCLRKFLAIPKGSRKLDPSLGRKLRELVDDLDDLLEPTLHDFLQAVFERVVVTSTFVERIFKDLTCWTGRHQQTVETIAAKHVNQTFDATVKRWRATLTQKPLASALAGKVRPPWTKTCNRGSGTTGYHIFLQGQPKADVFNGTVREAWANLDESERCNYEARAAHKRNVAKSRGSQLDLYIDDVQEEEPEEGPWELSSRRGFFSMHTGPIQRVMATSTMSKMYRKWRDRFEAKVLPAPEFPSTVPFDGPTRTEIPVAHEPVVREMLEAMRLALRYSDEARDAGLLFEFRHGDASVYALAGHTMHLERNQFEAELLRMDPQTETDSRDLPLVLQYVKSVAAHGAAWPSIETETEFLGQCFFYCPAVAIPKLSTPPSLNYLPKLSPHPNYLPK
jgi:hypothetical protein